MVNIHFLVAQTKTLVLALILHFLTFYIQSVASHIAQPMKYIQNLTSSHYLYCSTLVHAIIISHLDYSSSFLTGLFILSLHPPQHSLQAVAKVSLWKYKGTSLVVQWLRHHASKAEGLGSIPVQGTSHMLQLRSKIPSAATKTWCSQINKQILYKRREQNSACLFSKPSNGFHDSIQVKVLSMAVEP